MTEKTIFCDHCGKRLDEMKDYVDEKIIVTSKIIEFDLCRECADRLQSLLEKYIKGRQ